MFFINTFSLIIYLKKLNVPIAYME